MMARRYTAQEIVNELLDVVDEDDSEDDFEGYVTEEESGSSDSEVDDSENSDSEGDYSEGGREWSGAGEDGREWSGAGEGGREWSGAGEGGIGGGRDGSDAGEGGIGGAEGGRDGSDAGEGGIGGGSGTGGGRGAGEGGSGAGEGGSGAGEGGSGAGEGGSGAGEGGSGAGEGRHGSIPVFRGQPGCVVDMTNKEPIDFFSLMVPESLLQTICEQTLLYSQQYVTSNDISRRSRVRVQQWLRHEHDVKELKKFLACIIVMGVINYPAMEDWWCTSWPYATRSISSIMSRDRFSLFLRFLHLNDNTQYIPKGQPGHDPLFKVRPFLDPLLSNFRSNYSAHREISVDEQMIGFKGRLHFIQYLPKKPTRWGMKAFVLADSHDGYVLKWKLYTGK